MRPYLIPKTFNLFVQHHSTCPRPLPVSPVSPLLTQSTHPLPSQPTEHRIQLLIHILDEHGFAELERVLQRSDVVGVRQLHYRQTVVSFHVLHPLTGLTWRRTEGEVRAGEGTVSSPTYWPDLATGRGRRQAGKEHISILRLPGRPSDG